MASILMILGLFCGGMLLAAASLMIYFRARGRGMPLLSSDYVVVTNLDAIKNRTIAFRYNGKVHKIKPLSVEKYVEAAAAMAAIAELIENKKKVKSEAQLLDAYHAIFSVMCPTVSRSDLNEMSVQQIGALYNTVLEQIMGRENFEAQKKSPSSGQLLKTGRKEMKAN